MSEMSWGEEHAECCRFAQNDIVHYDENVGVVIREYEVDCGELGVRYYYSVLFGGNVFPSLVWGSDLVGHTCPEDEVKSSDLHEPEYDAEGYCWRCD